MINFIGFFIVACISIALIFLIGNAVRYGLLRKRITLHLYKKYPNLNKKSIHSKQKELVTLLNQESSKHNRLSKLMKAIKLLVFLFIFIILICFLLKTPTTVILLMEVIFFSFIGLYCHFLKETFELSYFYYEIKIDNNNLSRELSTNFIQSARTILLNCFFSSIILSISLLIFVVFLQFT